MTAVTASIELAVAPQAVWDVIMDPARYADWVTIHRRLGRVDDGPLRAGFQVEQTLALHHAGFKVHWVLTACDEPRHAIWEGRGPAGSHARIEDLLTPLDGGRRTRLDYRNEYENPGGLLGRLAGRVFVAGAAEREAERSLARLKALLES